MTQARVRGFGKERRKDSPEKTTRPDPPIPQTTSSLLPGPEAPLPLPHGARHLYKGSFPGSRHSQHQQTHGGLRSPGSLGLGRSRRRRHLSSATLTARDRPAASLHSGLRFVGKSSLLCAGLRLVERSGLSEFRAAIGQIIQTARTYCRGT